MKSAEQYVTALKRRLNWLRNCKRQTSFHKQEAAAIEWAILNTEHIVRREEANAVKGMYPR